MGDNGPVKRRRLTLQLSYRQSLALALLLVVLLAVSLLYCLGFASMALLQAWEDQPLPWNDVEWPIESIDTTPAPLPTEPEPQSSPTP